MKTSQHTILKRNITTEEELGSGLFGKEIQGYEFPQNKPTAESAKNSITRGLNTMEINIYFFLKP